MGQDGAGWAGWTGHNGDGLKGLGVARAAGREGGAGLAWQDRAAMRRPGRGGPRPSQGQVSPSGLRRQKIPGAQPPGLGGVGEAGLADSQTGTRGKGFEK